MQCLQSDRESKLRSLHTAMDWYEECTGYPQSQLCILRSLCNAHVNYYFVIAYSTQTLCFRYIINASCLQHLQSLMGMVNAEVENLLEVVLVAARTGFCRHRQHLNACKSSLLQRMIASLVVVFVSCPIQRFPSSSFRSKHSSAPAIRWTKFDRAVCCSGYFQFQHNVAK